MTRRLTIVLSLAAFCLALTSVFACEIRVRDSAFRIQRDIHRLCVIADSSDESAEQITQRLNQWLEETEGAINLEIVRVDSDDPETNWRVLGIPSAPPTLPVTVLVGRNNGIGENFVIDHWEPSPTTDDLSAIIDSPVRQRLARELAQNVAVLLYAPKNPVGDSTVKSRMQSLVDAGVADERIGLKLITIDRNDPAEKLLCRFMGLRPDSPDTLCVAFGRGKLMSPPLVDDEIDSENVNALITQIRQACSCSQPLPTMGVDIPLVWSDAIDSTVVLMDDEIALADLDAEVQNMLAAKATSEVAGDPSVIPIPPGNASASQLPVAHATTSRIAGIAIGFVMLCAVAVAFVMSRRRSSSLDSVR